MLNSNVGLLADYFLPIMSDYPLITSKQSTRLLHTLLGSKWFGVFWRRFGSISRHVWQWAPKISCQPWSSPWCCPAAPCSRISILRVLTVTFFCKFLVKPNINLELNCIFGKPMKRRFQRCNVHTETLSTFHTRHTHTHTTVLRLYGFCPGQPGWAGTRRYINPLTPIVVINRPLSASSI